MSLKRLNDLFDQILELPTEEDREAFVERECGDNLALKKELMELLQAHYRGNAVLESPTHAIDLVAHHGENLDESEGSMVGNYKLLQKIGVGGMGVVFMAEQLRPIRRKVALKIIREGMNSKQIIARFEAEREALARLDHPNVTRILDAGVASSGRPFFAMELVRGTHITQFCKAHSKPIRDRLELLEKVCLVIHHAHQKGILHRDIKPSNVMITLHDGLPAPKVIDFGIAKALDRPLTEQTLFTRYGDLIGTPEYMSPEQAEMSGLDLDVRTDIFSLGVLLYELLTGSTPLTSEQIQGKGLLKIFETIRDSEAEVPSLRLTRTASAAETAQERQLGSLALLQESIVGELDWITMKAIAKDRNERYESAAAMAKDIRRYLQGEPVDAAAPTFAYHAKKFYQKHRSITLIASSCAMLLMFSTALSVYWAILSNRQRDLVQVQSEELIRKSGELEDKKELLEAALDRALLAEKRAAAIARNERFKAARVKTSARFFGEDAQHRFMEIVGALRNNKNPPLAAGVFGFQTTLDEVPGQELKGGAFHAGVTINVSESTKSDVKIQAGEFPSIRIVSSDPSSLKVESVQQKMPRRYFELLVEELRKEFGNSDVFVAIALQQYATSLSDGPSPDSLVQAENHLRESISILEPLPDESLEKVKTMIALGNVLKQRDKSIQAETILAEAGKVIQLKVAESPGDEKAWHNLQTELQKVKDTSIAASPE